MDNTVYDMSNSFIEHSLVINNFVTCLGHQLSDSLCRVLGEGVQYQWTENNNKYIVPDASINCNFRDRKNVCLTGVPRMVMEVISDSTEKVDRGYKMDIYNRVGISEYWLVDWRVPRVEIYLNEGKEDGTTYWSLYKVITENNKEDLQLVTFRNLKITFDELFNI